MNKPHAHIRSDIVAQRLAKSKELKRHFAHDVAMLSVTAALISTMQAQGVTRTELADRIGKSKAFVSQVLSGSRNMTLRTIADIALALGKELCGMQLRDIGTTQVSADAMNIQAALAAGPKGAKPMVRERRPVTPPRLKHSISPQKKP